VQRTSRLPFEPKCLINAASATGGLWDRLTTQEALMHPLVSGEAFLHSRYRDATT
jgi:hypothetical protein